MQRGGRGGPLTCPAHNALAFRVSSDADRFFERAKRRFAPRNLEAYATLGEPHTMARCNDADDPATMAEC